MDLATNTQVVEPSEKSGEITIDPQQIELEGLGHKRAFKGWELWSRSDNHYESAVYLTARRRDIVYWHCVPGADVEEFRKYDSIHDFLDDQSEWLDDEERGQYDKSAIMRAYFELTGEMLVEDLDI
jgi:hypothetical protein